MISRVFKLVDVKRIEMVQREVHFSDNAVIVKPDYMSICAADRRYYFGQRKKEIMSKKLPMALIHEATGTVMHDFTGQLAAGTKVVLVPLISENNDSGIKENYRPGSIFQSSGADGFMQDLMVSTHDRLIPVPANYSIIYVFSELMSVVLNAIEAFEQSCLTEKRVFGVWGDGSVGYVMCLALKCLYPDAQVYMFGKTARKLQRFSFVDKVFYIDQIPQDVQVDHGFECVGGTGSESAIEQILSVILPQGCVSLLGVSEDSIAINTRIVLEKGLCLIGSSRSNATDFRKAVSLIQDNVLCQKYLQMLISQVVEAKRGEDISFAFEQDTLNDFKTVMKWMM